MAYHPFALFASHRRFRFFLFSVAVLLLAGFGLAGMWNAGKTRAAVAPAAPLMSSCTTPSFGAAANFAVGTAPKSVAVGDFNRDGRPDLATANQNSTNLSVLLGNGAGSFGAANNIALVDVPRSIAVGDFNRDGNLDLTVANPVGDDVSLLLGNGAGGFGAPVAFGTGMSPSFVAVGDFNRDGNLDLVTTNQLSDSVSVLLGNGAGNFGPATDFGVGSQPISVVVGDFNLDGISDLAVANLVSNNVSLLLGDGGGGFGTAMNFAAGNGPSSVATGDFNLDGRPDLAVVLQTPNSVAVLLGNGAGSFGAPANFGVGSLPLSVAVGDANLDGKPDLVVANALSNSVSVLLGNGAGSFGAATNFGTATRPESVAVGDFNLDGRLDLAAANNSSNNVSVLLNTCNGTPCSATNFGAATNFNAGAQANSVVIGDFNRDGSLDLAVSNAAPDNVSVYLGNGAGSFGAAVNFSTGTGTAPLAVTAGDFNKDGSLDLATANFQSNNISVLLGNGAGSFGAPANYAFGNQPSSIAVEDFNHDGSLDIVTANLIGDNVTVYQGDGMGAFGAGEPYSAGDGAFGVAVGDFNLDGTPDVAVANLLSDNVSILLGNGMGGLGTATNFAVGNGPGYVQVGDFNQDGRPDLAVANTSNPSTTVSVLLGNGAGSFGAATNFTVGLEPAGLAIGDYNRDGKPDIATVNGGGNNISVIAGNGAGSFGAAVNFAVGTTPQGLATGDFNRDGKADLVATNYNSGNISVRLNTCVSNTPPNLNVLGPLTISQGSDNNLNIAIATDPDQANNTLMLSVTPLTGSGVSYSGFVNDISGTHAAIVSASCTATNSTFQVTVTDNQGAMVSGVQTVNVTPNTAPTLGQYGNTALTFGQNTTVIPNAVPADNGSVSTLTATAPGFTGTLNANVTTGVVTVTNAGPIGSHTVTVTATDNCGTTSTRTFALTVTSPTTTGCATPSFGAATNFGPFAAAQSVATGDFNLDGKPDLVVTNTPSNNASVLLGNGAGSFGTATNFPGGGVSPSDVAVGDFNLDGKPDWAVVNLGSNNVGVLLGNGAGSFAAATSFNVGTSPDSIAVGDFNLDGKPDLIAGNTGGGNISVLLGNGAGSFGAATNFSANGGVDELAVSDFNLDGKADVATANFGASNVSVLLGNGTGGFGAPATLSAGTGPMHLAAGDFNLDGRPDLAVANRDSNNVSVLLGNGAGGFGAAANFGVGTNPTNVVTGDFNLDGKPDLAVVNSNSNNLSVLLGNGAGSFSAATSFSVTTPQALAVGDFNLDGRPDLATANSNSTNASVLLNSCAGTPCSGTSFAGATNFTAGTTPRSVAVGDFNLDGKSDLAVTNQGTNNVSILIGNGAGNFGAATNFAVGTLAFSVAVGDFNLDGKPDLAVANFNSDNVSVLLGTGSGSFGAATNFATGARPDSIAVGDFNNDGKSDLATANFNSNNVSVLLGNGSGGFGAATNFAVGIGRPQSVVVGDFNNDGKSDLATANETTNNVSILLGDGSGSFGTATDFAVGTSPETIVAGDFNNDGKSDLATANFLSNNVSILLGDGSGSFGTATNLATGIQPTSIAVGDFNRDGKSDLATKNASNIAILPGDGSGGFGAAINFPVPAGIRSIQVGDFNLDGRPDLATANTFNNNVSVLLSNCFSGAQTITVNTTADTVAADGFCSLREAITAANSNTPINECPSGAPGLDSIVFNLGAGTPSIAVTSALPTITDAVTINGATGGATRIELNGTSAGASTDGLQVSAGGSIIRNLVINRFGGSGIELLTGTGHVIHGCYIGTNAAGTAALGNSQSGINVFTPSSTIGGTTAAAANVISGNLNDGVVLFAGLGNVVQGNFIGTNATGTAAIANGFTGVSLQAAANGAVIGGQTAGMENIISGNTLNGVRIASSNVIVQGNLIGTNAAGSSAIANGSHGVEIAGGSSNTIGGTDVDAGNTIAFNTLNGIAVTGAATGNNLSGNLIFSNTLQGIDLGNNGVTANDAGDGDTGPNNLQNFPVLSSAVRLGSTVAIQGTLNSTAKTPFRIEFFSSAACDASGNGEGQIYLGFANVTTDAGGNAVFSVELPVSLTLGQVVTATATDSAGNTSEFSPCGCTFNLSPTQAGFAADGGNGGVNLTTGGGCLWIVISNSPWINITGPSSGSGNGLITYTVAANPATTPRTGSISIAGFTFYVTQAAGGLLLNEDFSGGIPEDWTVVNGGTGDLSWEDDNPCNVVPGPPIVPPFVIVDLSCAANDVIPDESLITPPFDASGLSQVILQFDTWFKFTPGGLNVIGDVDVSTNGGVNWVNVLRLQGANENPNTRTLDITAAVSANPANVRVRFHYYAVGPRPAGPSAPRGQELSWVIDRPTILALSLGPLSSPPIPPAGDTGSVMVTVPDGYVWSAQSNSPWITLLTNGGTGRGPLGYTVAAHTGACQRAGGITVSLQGTGLNPAPNATHAVTQLGTGLTISPATLPNGFVGTNYSQTLTPSGGTPPYTCSLDSGSLPAGVSLSGCALSGTPSAGGSFNFTIRTTDNAGCAGTRSYGLTILGGTTNGLQFYPLASPVRLLDTRSGAGISGCTIGTGAFTANSTRTQAARTACSTIPANATAVIGNITVVPTGPGFLTLFPGDATQPTVANSNFTTGEITNNVFTVGLDAAGGAFKIFSSAPTDVVIDVTGYYAPPAPAGLYYHPLPAPVRLVETRSAFAGCFKPSQLAGTGNPNADPNLDLPVLGRSPGLPSPCNSIPSDAVVLVGNATTVFPGGGGYLTIYPSDAVRPTVASSNYAGGDIINGPFAVKLGADGRFKIYTLLTTDLVVDITGYYSASATDANGTGLLFNPLPGPVRLLETRPGGPPLVGCTRTNAPIAGNVNAATHTQPARNFCGLPASAQAVVGNVSVVNTAGAGFLTLFPGNLTTAPLVATSNYPAPATFGYNRHYFVGLSPADGTFKVLTQFTTDLILDASGYFAP